MQHRPVPRQIHQRRLRRLLPAVLLTFAAGTPFAGAQTDVADVTLPDAPAPQQSPSTSSSNPPAPTAQTPPNTQQQPGKPSSEDVLHQEEHQRILGVVPNFNTVETSANVPPLSPGQKFHLAFRSTIDPFVFVAAGFVAGIGQAQDSHPGFGQGASGYFKRFGASYADTASGTFWGNAVLPVLFKEDPRYYRLGTGSYTHRLLYSASTAVWGRRDNGTWGPNYANVLGNFIAGGISNAYYPAEDRGFGQTVSGAAIVTAEGAVGAAFYEFWPDISQKFLRKRHLPSPSH